MDESPNQIAKEKDWIRRFMDEFDATEITDDDYVIDVMKVNNIPADTNIVSPPF
jgi:hypothetical protein